MPTDDDEPDPYFVLGISADASGDEIKDAYRRRVRDVHPDVNQAPRAAATFRLVQRAFDILGDPEARRRYDESAAGHGDRDDGLDEPPNPSLDTSAIDFGTADKTRHPREKVVLAQNSGGPVKAVALTLQAGDFWTAQLDLPDDDAADDVIAVLIITERIRYGIKPGPHVDTLELLVDDIPLALSLSIVVPANYFGDTAPTTRIGSYTPRAPLGALAFGGLVVVVLVFLAWSVIGKSSSPNTYSGSQSAGSTAESVPGPVLIAGKYPLSGVVNQGDRAEVSLISFDVASDRTVTLETRIRNISDSGDPLTLECNGGDKANNAQLFFGDGSQDLASIPSIATDCTGYEDTTHISLARGESAPGFLTFAPDRRFQPSAQITMYWSLQRFDFEVPYPMPGATRAPAPASVTASFAGDSRGTANWGPSPLPGVEPHQVVGPGELHLELWGVKSPNAASTAGYLSLTSKANTTSTPDCGWYLVSRFDAPLTESTTSLRTTLFTFGDFYSHAYKPHAVCDTRQDMTFELSRLTPTTLSYKMYSSSSKEELIMSGTLTLKCAVMDMRSSKCP